MLYRQWNYNGLFLVLLTGIVAGLGGCAVSPTAVSPTAETRALINSGTDINVKDKFGQTPLYRAARNGSIEIVTLLLEANADVNCTTRQSGATPLYIASQQGHTQIVRALLAAKADVDVTIKGNSPLFVAARKGHIEIVRLLLESGADINIVKNSSVSIDLTQVTSEGKFPALVTTITPLQIAEQNGHYNIVKLLREYDAKE